MKSVFERIFPIKYDFFEMLAQQAQVNAEGIAALYDWLTYPDGQYTRIHGYAKKADEVRMDLEKNLVQAFSTPFDRGDIYLISVSMDKVIKYAQSTIESMKAFAVRPDDFIVSMAGQLLKAANEFALALKALEKAPLEAERLIPSMRASHVAVEELYRKGMAGAFASDDAMWALKYREVSHHLKDASLNLEDSVNILHRIIVRLT